MSKNRKIIFTLSFLLNIILIGIVLGGMFKPKSFKHFKNVEISQDTKKKIHENMKKNRLEMREFAQQMKSYKQDLKAIIIAENFDERAYTNKMTQVLAVKNTMATQKAKTLGQTLSTLTQEERKEISGHVLRQLSGKRHTKRKGRNHMKKKDNPS